MRKLSPFSSGAFRFALLVALVFAAGTFALLYAVERAVSGYATEVASDSVSAEVAVIEDEDRVAGRVQAIQSVVRRENAVREHQLRYLLVDRDGHYLAGSLPASAAHLGWRTMTLPNRDPGDDDGAQSMALMSLGGRLSDGGTVVVASDTSDLVQLRQSLWGFAVSFGGAITLLALIGGYIVGSLFLRRLAQVNASVGEIMHGRFTERLPSIGMSREFDQLSQNLNRMLDRIETLMEGMRHMSTNIAHDLRTPLTRLRQRLEEMKEGSPGSVTGDQIDGALCQIDHVLTIFRALLRIGALEAGTAGERLTRIDLSAFLAGLADAYRPVAEDGGHVLTSAIEPGLFVHADPEMLAQAVINVIENAIVHTPYGSTVSIALQRRGGNCSIVVADNGPGIPQNERGHVLKRFYRLNGSSRPGAGLGLALVAAVAAVHGARLVLADNHPGLRVELEFDQAQSSV
ncbi:MAG: hypothetical protein BGN95_03125 [Sphingomonas sp. 66-10]|uniref:sensor histidine kinase n=1 Tax=Sphingomonas sp. 66-10 TaxID=1895848 RepID=UPI00092B5CBA|nr:ATP-binding protein [Sphingomonas sp. 66-10]OJU15117.1 MAG: hypothetical protein BGN95_03125 [Sphingomonas sp. 66-10]